MKASLVYRISAVLLLLFAVGHTLGFQQSDPSWGVDTLLGLMRSSRFDVQGFSRSYWDLFLGRGVLSLLGGAGLAARPPRAGDPGDDACRRLGVRPVLRGHLDRELAIPLRHSDRLLGRGHRVPVRWSMAFG